MLANALAKYASEATTHCLARLTGNRPHYVKAFWLILFLTFLTLCVMGVQEAYLNFVSGSLKTTIKANELEFEFPDVYICNESPISGSYSVTLGAEDTALLRHFRRLVNESVAGIGLNDTSALVDNYAIRLVNTLPYQFLADKMGRRANQLIVIFNFNGNFEPSVRVFRHPALVNCFVLNLTDTEIQSLQNPAGFIQIGLFLDPLLPVPFDNSTDQDIFSTDGSDINIKPVDWNLNYGTDSTASQGFRLFLTPRGQQPSNFDARFSIGPAQSYQLSIKMQDMVHDEDVSGRCLSDTGSTQLVEFVDPYSLDKQIFKYSQGSCWYSEVARLSMERFKCIAMRHPIPWEYRLMPSCFNLTQFPTGIVYDYQFQMERERMLFNAMVLCATKVPCRQRTYSYDYSSSLWPTERIWNTFLRNFTSQTLVNKGGPTPGFSYLVNNATFQQVHESLLLLEMSAAEFRSPEVRLSLAYGFSSLTADVGGLLGLFLGMSLLSALELLELLHDCCLIAWQQLRRRRLRFAVEDESQVARSETSVCDRETATVTRVPLQ